jgi:putative component of membrane protein insertase Oxa1/YidC/SpoIIIJ protein YidD
MLSTLALVSIEAYQRWLSPFKGFHCAYSVVHGDSCSDRIKQAVAEHGLFAACPLALDQFAKCRTAMAMMSPSAKRDGGSASSEEFAASKSTPENTDTKSNGGSSDCHDGLSACACLGDVAACL